MDERSKKVYGYWHLILPGSKRIIRGSSMLGNNTDVRPPAPDELWKGGGLGFGGGSRSPQGPLKAITLVLDGVFFADGGFAGPDTLHNFDRITASVAAHLQVGNMARDGHYQGRTPAEIFRQIEAITGPDRGPAVPPPPRSAGRGYNDDRQDSLRDLAWRIAGMRHSIPDEERALDRLMSWANADIPKFRKL
ncbi:MAG TPA: hypothetical protein VG675_00295 [Bryobacteraceae bacterium]|nr:hypothetical protein [Bryobacteraceae bacterium]